jgi:hypothetical protein
MTIQPVLDGEKPSQIRYSLRFSCQGYGFDSAQEIYSAMLAIVGGNVNSSYFEMAEMPISEVIFAFLLWTNHQEMLKAEYEKQPHAR